MVLLPWLRKAQQKFAHTRNSQDRFLLDVAEFRREAARERVRAERSNTFLAVLVIELPALRRRRCDLTFLGNVLSERLRITDTAGRLPDGRLAVLFPDTPKAGAGKLPATFATTTHWDTSDPTAKYSSIPMKARRLKATRRLAPSNPSRYKTPRWNHFSQIPHRC